MARRTKLGGTGTTLLVAGAFALAFVTWFLFVGRLGTDELWGAIPGSLLAAVATWVVLEQHVVGFSDRAGYLLEAWRLPGYMVTGTIEIFRVLLRQLLGGKPAPSLLLAVPYDALGDDPGDAAKRALAIAYTTSTPNFIVLGIDHQRGTLVFHQIERGPILEMLKRLGARP
jgi:multisubunit Na+/H+ antiporter MnhE subunit